MPLNKAQLKQIEKRLHEEKDRLLEQLREFSDEERSESSQDQDGDLSKVPTHPADEGTDVATEELRASIASRRSTEIVAIEAALDRLINSPDEFGKDENTGEDIPFERLDIIPWARTAVHH